MAKRESAPPTKSLPFAARIVKSKVDGSASLVVENKQLMKHRLADLKDGERVMLYVKSASEKSIRTGQQNRAMHLYFELLAQALNDGGYTVQLVLKEKVDIDWNKDAVKELLWRPAQMAILKKASTTELKKQEDIDKVYEHLNRHLGEKFGLHVEFPSNEPGYADTAPLKADDEKKHDKSRNGRGKERTGDR